MTTAETTPHIEDPARARTLLKVWVVVAIAVSIGLLLLVLEMFYSYVLGLKGSANPLHWWPQPHGFIYMVYLVATALLGFAVNWPLRKMVLVMLAGCVPVLSIYVEARVNHETKQQIDAAAEASAAAA